MSPACQRWKYFARFCWSRFAEGDAAGQLGSIGVFNSLRSLAIFLSNPSVFSNSPENATFPKHLYRQSTLDDDSNCVETLSSKSERVVQNLIQALWRWHSEKNWQMIAIFRKCHQSVVEKVARDNFMFWKRKNKMKIIFSESKLGGSRYWRSLNLPYYHLRVEGTLFEKLFNQLVVFIRMMMMMVIAMRLRTMMTWWWSLQVEGTLFGKLFIRRPGSGGLDIG